MRYLSGQKPKEGDIVMNLTTQKWLVFNVIPKIGMVDCRPVDGGEERLFKPRQLVRRKS